MKTRDTGDLKLLAALFFCLRFPAQHFLEQQAPSFERVWWLVTRADHDDKRQRTSTSSTMARQRRQERTIYNMQRVLRFSSQS